MTRILLAGVAVADFVFNVDAMPRKAEKYRAVNAHICGGGNAANSAVAASRLGANAMLAARVGDDFVGRFILDELAGHEVDTTLVNCISGGVSSFSSIYVDSAGERQITNFRGQGLGEHAEWLDDVPEFDVLLADNRWEPLTVKAIQIAHDRNVPAIVDAEPPFDQDAVKLASHVAFSAQGISEFTGLADPVAALQSASSKLDAWVCVTNGAEGTYFIEDGRVENIPATTVEAKETLGAGDVWHGAFAVMIAEGKDIRSAVQFANAAGTLKSLRSGGPASAPTRAETEQFLSEHCQQDD
ncbi:MAG: PfkB family carbohydrate kinase [Anderseniella sp.]